MNSLKKCERRSLRGSGVRGANLYHVVTEEHDFEEEGDDYVEEDDWDDEYPAYTRVRLGGRSMSCHLIWGLC